MNDRILTVKQMIGKGNANDAVSELFHIIRDSKKKYKKLEEELIIVESRIALLKSSIRKGTIREEEKLIEQNKINESLIHITNEVEVLSRKDYSVSKQERLFFPRLNKFLFLGGIAIVLLTAYSFWRSDLNSFDEIEKSLIDNQGKSIQGMWLNSGIDFNEDDLIGLWNATNAFMLFNNDGTLELFWKDLPYIGYQENGTWQLKNDTLLTVLGKAKSTYAIAFMSEDKFSFGRFSSEEADFTAVRNDYNGQELSELRNKTQVVCSLEGTRYESRITYDEDYIRFLNKDQNMYEYTGKISIYSIGGAVNLYDNKIHFISGNVNGNVTIDRSCKELVGSIQIVGSHNNKDAIDFIKKR